MNYKENRSYLNCERMIFPSSCNEGFPQLLQCELNIDYANMVGFNHALTEKKPNDKICHFFMDDYQFERIWKAPDRYINILKRFKAIIAPDFSTYTNFPKVVQQFNHYRNLWLARYFQANGINVIPNISFSDKSSFDWIFKGQPKNSLCCLSTVGCFQRNDVRELYLIGVKRAIKEIKPTSLLIYGKLHDELSDTLKSTDFTGTIIVGSSQNFTNLEAKSKRNLKKANAKFNV